MPTTMAIINTGKENVKELAQLLKGTHENSKSLTNKLQTKKNDVKKIEAEIEHRKLVVRKEAIEAVKEARAQGDLSENFEYYAAKRDKNKNEGRIRYLEKMLKTAEIVNDSSKEDEVGINNEVEIYFEDKKKLVSLDSRLWFNINENSIGELEARLGKENVKTR